MTTSERPLRADAERNRQRILAAAAEVFAERGLDVSLDDIAAHAGVGVGTVYRRFPNKDELIDALFLDKIEDVVKAAEAALEVEDPFEGLKQFMFGVCELHAGDMGLKDAMMNRASCGSTNVAQARAKIAPVAEQVFERARRAGAIRDDIDVYDVPMLNFTVIHAAERTRPTDPDYWKRLLTIVIDGMVPRRDDVTPLPAGPLDPERFQAAMRSMKS